MRQTLYERLVSSAVRIASASPSAMVSPSYHSSFLPVSTNNNPRKSNASHRELPPRMGLSRSGAELHAHGTCRSCRHRCRRHGGRWCSFLLGQSSGSRGLGRGTYVGPTGRGRSGAPANVGAGYKGGRFVDNREAIARRQQPIGGRSGTRTASDFNDTGASRHCCFNRGSHSDRRPLGDRDSDAHTS